MKLIDLDPFWLVKENRRVGFSFISPINPEWRQIVCSELIPMREQWQLTNNARADSACISQTGNFAWTIENGIENASFENLTVTPSIDGSKGGLWHGWIREGNIV